jgi:hypothetical protein
MKSQPSGSKSGSNQIDGQPASATCLPTSNSFDGFVPFCSHADQLGLMQRSPPAVQAPRARATMTSLHSSL